MKPMIYVAANGQEPVFVQELIEHYKILHPGFQFEGDVFSDAPQCANEIEKAFSMDFYGISKSDVLIYDADSDPGTHFIAWAYSLNIPVVVVSQNFVSPGPYWSLAIDFLVKPEQLLGHLKAVSRNLEEKRKAEAERNQKIIDERSSKTPQPDAP